MSEVVCQKLKPTNAQRRAKHQELQLRMGVIIAVFVIFITDLPASMCLLIGASRGGSGRLGAAPPRPSALAPQTLRSQKICLQLMRKCCKYSLRAQSERGWGEPCALTAQHARFLPLHGALG